MDDWSLMEKRLARRLKGRKVPGSGSGRMKGDVRTTDFVVEAKWRSGDFIDVREGWLVKTAEYADRAGRRPMVAVCIGNRISYCLVPRYVLEEVYSLFSSMDPLVVECRRQIRIRADADWSFKVVRFPRAGEWVVVPEDDFVFIFGGFSAGHGAKEG